MNAAGSWLAQRKPFLTVPVFFSLFIGFLIGNFILPHLQLVERPPDCALLYLQSDDFSGNQGLPGEEQTTGRILVEPRIYEYHRAHNISNQVKTLSAKTRFNLIHITVKTTATNVDTRLPTLRKTWLHYSRLLRNILKVVIVTDHDLVLPAEENHLVPLNSHCPKTHELMDLCCKTQVEFRTYYLRREVPAWFCRFDDDNYVNLNNLVTLLEKNDSVTEYIYVGRRSIMKPVGATYTALNGKKTDVTFEFLNGGSGLCFAKSLMGLLKPIMFGVDGMGKGFTDMCSNMGHADDVILGYFVTNVLAVRLTESMLFNSQSQNLESLTPEDLLEAITLSYRNHESTTGIEATVNVPGFPGIPNKLQDPTRFLALHKFLLRNGFYSVLSNTTTT